MHFLQFAPVWLLFGTAISASTPSSFVLHEKRDSVPSAWVKRSRAPLNTDVPVRLGIAQRNRELGHDYLMDVSDPNSPNFGKHWTPQQIADTFSPTKETLDAVREWLAQSGIATERHIISPSRGHMQFRANVSEVEELLATEYHLWEHTDTGDITLSCEQYHVPHHMKHDIDFITPTIGFNAPTTPNLSKRGSSIASFPSIRIPAPPIIQSIAANGNLSSCDQAVTPECIKALYGIPANDNPQDGNALGIFESGDYYDQEDLDLFFTNYYPTIPNGTHPTLQSVDGGEAPVDVDEGGGESTLDFELAYPIVYPQEIKLYQVDDENNIYPERLGFGDTFLDALDASFCTYEGGDNKTIDPIYPDTQPGGYNQSEQCGAYTPTNVISVSYGLSEAFYSPFYEQRQCDEFMKLGLAGTTVLYASGDNGTLARAGLSGCLSGGRNNPNFPASCPYITTVGATQIKNGSAVTDPEEAVDPDNIYSFSSGGGFSNVFAQPSYQSDAVATFLASPGAPADPAPYNASGRAFPDVSANGWNIATYANGIFFLNGGTSASTPIWGGIVTLVNEQRIAAGKGPVGFLNPTLYANPGVFNDITEGYNLGCNADVGFNATEGWDPVTGLGTPKFQDLVDLFLGLP